MSAPEDPYVGVIVASGWFWRLTGAGRACPVEAWALTAAGNVDAIVVTGDGAEFLPRFGIEFEPADGWPDEENDQAPTSCGSMGDGS